MSNTWHMAVASGEDGLAISEWYTGEEAVDEAVREACRIAGYSDYDGHAMVIECELGFMETPPNLVAWNINPELAGINLDDDEEDEDAGV